MLLLATDADVDGRIVRGLRRRQPDLDLRRSLDSLPDGTPDPDVLEWTATEQRVLLTRDRSTMIGFAHQRLRAGKPMPGIVVTTKAQPIGKAVEDILIIAHCMSEDEIRNQIVLFLPL